MFNNNKVNMIISLLCAIALWFYVVGQVDPKTEKKYTDIPVTLINEDSLTDDGLAIADMDYDTVTVVLEGKRAYLNRIDKDEIKVTADMKDLHKGTNTVTLKASVPKNADITAVAPETIDVIVESRVTESKPVEVKFTGEATEGEEPGNVTVDPENVQVTGAQSQVNKVTSVVAEVDLEDISENGSSVFSAVKPVSKSGKTVGNVELSTKTVTVSAEMMATKEVPVRVETVGEVSEDVQVDSIEIPDKVLIKGKKDYVDDVDSLTAADVDISSVKETTEIPLEIYLPDGIELAEESENVCVKIVIKELASQEFEISSSQVDLKDADEGLTGAIEEVTLKVTVKGTDTVLESITEEDIKLTADLSGLEAGTHKVKISVECSKEVSSVEVSPEKAEVTVREE